MSNPVRVLHVITGMGSGGAEAFIMNMYRNIDRTKVQFDFLLRSNENIYKDEINNLGGRIYTTASFPKHIIRNTLQVKRFFKEHKYKIIHVHGNALMYMTALKEAKHAGVPCRIMHSHSTSLRYRGLTSLHNHRKANLGKWATDNFACSEDAGKWMFSGEYKVINNAIDVEKFEFNINKRNEMRKQLGIGEDTFVVGHIGRFLEVKNHKFLLETFSEIVKHKKDAVLVLVGNGKLEQEVKESVIKKGLEKKVFFLGERRDVPDLLSGMDVFVFPSLYEGLPIVTIEAQANGLQVICSDAIPNGAIISPCIRKLPLEIGAIEWAKKIIELDIERIDTQKLISDAGFDIKVEEKKLQDFYLSNG